MSEKLKQYLPIAIRCMLMIDVDYDLLDQRDSLWKPLTDQEQELANEFLRILDEEQYRLEE